MTRNHLFAVVLAGASAVPMLAQEEPPASKNEVAVQGFGSFLKTTTSNGVPQSATNTGGVLASYRYFFTQHHGVEANYGFMSNTQSYSSPSNVVGLNNNTHEISAAYVFRMPFKRFTPFVLAGAGALVFDPRDAAGASAETRATFVYGGGADVNLTRHFFVRGEYRGLVYNSPTYNLTGLNGLDRVTHAAEPSVGFGYRF